MSRDDQVPSNFILEGQSIMDEAANGGQPSASSTTSGLRGRNGRFNAGNSPFPQMHHRQHRNISGAGGQPAYANLHQRYPSAKYGSEHYKKERSYSQSTSFSNSSETSHSASSSGSYHAGSVSSRNGMLFTGTASDNLSKSRSQKKLHDSPTSFSDTNRTLKEQHRISTLGLGIKVPKSPDRSPDSADPNILKTPDSSSMFENSPIRNPEDFPLVNFSSRRTNTSHKNSPASAFRQKQPLEDLTRDSPVHVDSDSSDELYNDVVASALDGSESKEDKPKKLFNDAKLLPSDLSKEVDDENATRNLSFNDSTVYTSEVDLSKLSDGDNTTDDIVKPSRKPSQQLTKKDFEKVLYKSKNTPVTGFKSPISEEEELTVNLDGVLSGDSFGSSPFGPLDEVSIEESSEIIENEDSEAFIASKEADAVLESKIKSLLLMKTRTTPKEDIEKKQDTSTEKGSSANGDHDSKNKHLNNKNDLYLDRFPSFSAASDLISPPRSPKKHFVNSATTTPLKLHVKTQSIDGATAEIILENEENTQKSESPKKTSFHTRKDSQTVINWDVTEPESWSLERVILWLNFYGFNKSWEELFSKYNVCGEKFLELTNDDQFSKFNTYLKLNNEYLDLGSSAAENYGENDGKATEVASNLDDKKQDENSEVFLSSSSRFRFLLKQTIEEHGTKANELVSLRKRDSSLEFNDDLRLLKSSRRVSGHHTRSNSDDITALTARFNVDSVQSTNLSSSISAGSTNTENHKSGKRLSYIKKPFESKNRSHGTPKDSPLSPYSSIFKRHIKSPESGTFVSPTNMNFPGNFPQSGSISSVTETDYDTEKKSGFLKKKFGKKEKLRVDGKSFGRKSADGTSPISPTSNMSFDNELGVRRKSKEIVGHIQLNDRQIPKPLPNKSSDYVLVTSDNIAYVPVGAELLQNVKDFKTNIARALNLPVTNLQRISFHMTDYQCSHGEALDDSTIDSFITFSFINHEVKFYAHYDGPTDLTYSSTRSTRSTKSSDTPSFEIAADNNVNYPATPASLINDGSQKATNDGEEVDYINFKKDMYSVKSPENGESFDDNSSSLTLDSTFSIGTAKSSFSVIRPEANRKEINFDKKRESPFVKNRDLIPQRPAPAPPAGGGLQRSVSISKRISKSSLNKEGSQPNTPKIEQNPPTAIAVKRSGTVRRISVRSTMGSSKARSSVRSSKQTFEENKISFEGVPALDEESEESEGSSDSDDGFWAVAPKAKEENDVDDATISSDGTEKQIPPPEMYEGKSSEYETSTGLEGSSGYEGPSGYEDKTKVNMEIRPSIEMLYNKLDTFFPKTDLDKPITVELDTPPTSPLDSVEKQPFSPISEVSEKTTLRQDIARSVPNMAGVPAAPGADEILMMPETSDKRVSRNSRRKTIRGIAREYSVARRRFSQTPEAQKNSQLLRRQSTKLWGRKVVELTSSDMRYDYISKLKNNKGEFKQFAWIKGELIGKGTYGKVFLALNITTGEMMAVKQVDVPRTGFANKEMKDIIDALLLEVKTMKDLDHPNIVQYLGFEEVGNTYSLFLDYVAGGSVGSCLRMYGKFDESLIRFLTRQVTDGLSYLHNRHILHRDLKADNLLLDLDGVCKITDFGISKRSENIYKNDSEMSMQGTIFWMAPEVIDNVVQNKKQGYSAKIDIWSLGCVVLEMFAGRRPWSNVEALSAMYRIGKTKLAPPIPDDIKPNVSMDGKQFLDQCFEIDPNKRPTALELFRQSKFCEFDVTFDFESSKLAEMIKSNAKQINTKPEGFGRR